MHTSARGRGPARCTPPMSTPTTSTGRATAGGRSHRGRPPLRSPLRKAVLVIHLLSAGAWIGIDVLVAVLVLVGWFGQPSTAGLAYRALGTFVAVPMLVAALVCLATGLLLGLATRWGLVRYWWVLVKLVLTVVLCVLIRSEEHTSELQSRGHLVC